MKQQRACNLIIILILTFTSIYYVSSSSQNLYAVVTTIGADHSSQPSNVPLIYQDFTTNLPTSANIEAEEVLDSSETNVLNRLARPSLQRDENEKDSSVEGPPDHVIPYSEHDETKEVPTQPKYTAPGVWAKPPPDKNVPLDFVPTKLHAQVRGSHTVKRLPQRQAIESAETDEDKRNAPRLREIVTNTKVNTVYTEEGYEDSAYDHAGHVRDADFHEGFAHKLHDLKKSGGNLSNGKKKKEKNRNSIPDEFKEYEEDYQDHFQENRKLEEADDENNKDNLIERDSNSWENSEIDPKFVAENNIKKLEEDIEKDAEEAERSSKIYQNAQESKLRDNIKKESSELEMSRVKDNLEHENKPVKTKKKKSKLQNKKGDVNKKSKKPLKSQQKKRLYPETTVFPFEDASLINVGTSSPHGFVTNSPNSQVYSIDQTTLHYVTPIATDSFQVDNPTTVSYSQLFWDYFKARQDAPTTEGSTLISNLTTLNPQSEVRTPIAATTFDGQTPYFLVTEKKTVTSPETFLTAHSFEPRNLFSDHIEFGSTSTQTHNRHLLGHNDDGHNVDYVDGVITTSTVATFTSVPPLNSEDATVSSSTPTVMTLNFTQEAYARISDYHENPFLGPVLDNSNIAVTKNKLKYKVLARAKPSRDKKPVKSVPQSPPRQVSTLSSKEKNEYKKIRDELNAKYNKMSNDIKNKQKVQSFPKEKKNLFRDDLTLKKPSTQQAAYSSILTDNPSPVNRSSTSAENKSPREANKRNEIHSQHRSQPIKLPFRFDSFAHVQFAYPIYRRSPLPTTKLLPPPPLLADTYANYRGNKQNDKYHANHDGKSQQRRDNSFKYFPLNSETSWRTRYRRKRSEGEFLDGGRNAMNADVKAVANNSVTNDNKSEQQDRNTFDRIIDRSEGKLSSGRITNAPNAVKLIFPAKSTDDESGTSRNKNDTISIGEKKDAKGAREIIIDISKLDKKELVQSIKQNEQINRTAVEMAKKKRDIKNETHLIKNMESIINENHEKLLNESPKISADVIDKEIAARFNEKDETSLKNNKKAEVEVPSFDYVEELVEDDVIIKSFTTTEAAIDLKKYPFYNNENIPSASALKYIVDPKTIPRKTSRGMEFYDSRNAYKQCDEVEPDLDKVLPAKEEPDPEKGPQEDLPRLRGLGDKLDCFKAKYFDENPLDNPLFAEKLVGEPTPPTELNPTKFASKIMVLPEEDDDYVVPQISKKPERSGRQNWRNRNRPYETVESTRVNYKYDPQTGKGRNAHFSTVRGTRLSNIMRKVKNRKPRPKITTTTSSSKYQTDSYQNQVYEDVMGNIRNMKNAYQVYEMTTLPSSTKVLVTAGSENTLKISDSTTSKEGDTPKPDVTDIVDVTNKTKSSEIKGLLPPPKYVVHRQNYRKHRPLVKSRMPFRRSPPTLSEILAHHHSIKLNKRSTTDDAKSSPNSTLSKNQKAFNNSIKVDAIKNDTLIAKFMEDTNKTNVTFEPLDLEVEESRLISTQNRNVSTVLKINDKKKRRNSANSNLESDPQKIVYTIRDRIRHSKPKWDTRGYGKFATSPKTMDEDSRRKEPRYNRIERKKKPVDDRRNNSTVINSTESTRGIESAPSLIEHRESSTTEVYHAEESAVQQMIYHKENKDSDAEKVKNIDVEPQERFFEEDEEESTTNTYQVRENIDEDVTATTTKPTNFRNSKEVLNLQEYLESDPPGYAETFSEEATTVSSKYHEFEDDEEKQNEETDFPRSTPIPSLFLQDEDPEELSWKEEEGSNKDQTFFTYTSKPSSDESDKDDEHTEKATFYKPFPFSRYESKLKKESEESSPEEESEEKEEENDEEKDETHVFPWHADKEIKDKYKWLHNFDRYEYPWERRERLARERRERKRAKTRLYNENEEESAIYEKPIYPWEKYDVPSKTHKVNTRRDISRRYDSEESTTEYVPVAKYSSRYSSNAAKPKFSNAREISKSIKKFLENDESNENLSKEMENRSPSIRKSDREIFKKKLVRENVTLPPRKKNARRRTSQIDKNVMDNSHFDSKKVKSEEIVNETPEENSMEYLKLNRSSLNDSELPAIMNNLPSNMFYGTKEVPSATTQRKKRRRRILKNNSTISLDNASAESVTKPTKKRRRKPEVSTTTSATPTTSTDFNSRKLILTPIRRRYLKKDEKTIPKTNKADDFQVETSAPKEQTLEHRSRISKEKIITKTTYPNATENFDSMKMNSTSIKKQPIKLRIKSKRRKNNINLDNKKKLIKQNDGDYEVKLVDEDDIKKSIILNKPQNENQSNNFENFGMKQEELNKINNFGTYDGVTNDENENDNGGFAISPEVYVVRNLLKKTPPNQERNQAYERIENDSNEMTEDWKKRNNSKEASEERKKDAEQKWKPLLQAKSIKDPERRLYYYVERK